MHRASQICTLLKRPGMRRHPVKIKTAADIVRAAQTFHSESVVPIFQVSNVTMDGIPDLHQVGGRSDRARPLNGAASSCADGALARLPRSSSTSCRSALCATRTRPGAGGLHD